MHAAPSGRCSLFDGSGVRSMSQEGPIRLTAAIRNPAKEAIARPIRLGQNRVPRRSLHGSFAFLAALPQSLWKERCRIDRRVLNSRDKVTSVQIVTLAHSLAVPSAKFLRRFVLLGRPDSAGIRAAATSAFDGNAPALCGARNRRARAIAASLHISRNGCSAHPSRAIGRIMKRKANSSSVSFNALERDYIRQELDLSFGTYPSVAKGFHLRA